MSAAGIWHSDTMSRVRGSEDGYFPDGPIYLLMVVCFATSHTSPALPGSTAKRTWLCQSSLGWQRYTPFVRAEPGLAATTLPRTKPLTILSGQGYLFPTDCDRSQSFNLQTNDGAAGRKPLILPAVSQATRGTSIGTPACRNSSPGAAADFA